MAAEGVSVAETHVSVVLFLGDRAYKLKKPVSMGFLDFSTRARRAAACRREVDLNRRIAPDVYLGVGHLVGPPGRGDAGGTWPAEPAVGGGPGTDEGEPVVVMRRMPSDASLAARVRARKDVTDDVRALARILVDFHGRAARGPSIDAAATAEALARRWATNLARMRPMEDSVFAAADLDEVDASSGSFLAGRDELFEQRIAAGAVCDGHGDLQAADIYCLDDGPRVLDCIEFDDELRHVDVADDVAFLAMDLERLGAPSAARTLVDAYGEFAGHPLPAALVEHYIAYRAQVRALVVGLRAGQAVASGAGTDADSTIAEARRFLDQCLAHLRRGAVRLVLVGGPPGTGKSTVAAGLAARAGWTVLRTDEVRREGGPTSAAGGHDPDRYDPARVGAVYAELLDRAGGLLRVGESVVLDATWSSAAHRAEARLLAGEHHAQVVELRCRLDPAEAAERVRARLETGADASEATPAVAAAMAAAFEPWAESDEVSTDRPPAEVDEQVSRLVGFPGV